MNTNKQQMSESLIMNLFLAFSGGFQDAYTYFIRDGVFSNAQTGNVVLMSERILWGRWDVAIRYLWPILAFVAGIFIAEVIGYKYKYAKTLHWRQSILIMEMLILFVVGFIPDSHNVVATVLVSLSCAMQVQTFRKVKGHIYASTMCIGNLRSVTENLAKYLREKDKKYIRLSAQYVIIILVFAIGAGLGAVMSVIWGLKVIWVSVAVLFISFLMMFKKECNTIK